MMDQLRMVGALVGASMLAYVPSLVTAAEPPIVVTGSISGNTATVYARGSGGFIFPIDKKEGFIVRSPTVDKPEPLYVSLLGPLIGVDYDFWSQYHREGGSATMLTNVPGGGSIYASSIATLSATFAEPTLQYFNSDSRIPVFGFDFFIPDRFNQNFYHCNRNPGNCPAGSLFTIGSFTQQPPISNGTSLGGGAGGTSPSALALGPLMYKVTAKQLAFDEVSTGATRGVLDVAFYYSFKAAWTLSYSPYSAEKYIADALQMNFNSGLDQSTFRQELASLAINQLVSLRETSAQTSGQNTALRDAEYFNRGLRGGYIFSDQTKFRVLVQDALSGSSTISNIFDIYGPVGGLIAYNTFKAIKGSALGYNLPASPPGGEEYNYLGYLIGSEDKSIKSIIERAAIADESHVKMTDFHTCSTSPCAPNFIYDFNVPGYTGTTDLFVAEVTDILRKYYFDPPQASNFSFAVLANDFLGFDYSALLSLGYSDLKIFLFDQTYVLDDSGYFDISALFPGGIDNFFLTGIGKSGLSEPPVFGFRFAETGLTVVTISSANATALAVPEPSVWMLYAMGLVAIGALRRCKIRGAELRK